MPSSRHIKATKMMSLCAWRIRQKREYDQVFNEHSAALVMDKKYLYLWKINTPIEILVQLHAYLLL